ncbi:MAG: GNAT family N-acetyltransferase [Bacteroidales bacterium]|jgi:dTDP-4-amino-4,6-dideoxy-D-galactose acyltransferase|nr:GNAT family N-acetyltransferase [Bacteroidales bacterium]
MIEFLPWESDFFSLRIGKVKGDKINISDLVIQKKDENYDILFVLMDEYNEEIHNLILSNDGILADKKVTFSKKIDQIRAFPEDIYSYTGEVNNVLKELSILSGHMSRFNLDKRLNFRFKEMYVEWIINSLNGKLADVVFVYEVNNIIAGFVTVRKQLNVGQIGLISVDSKFQGKGIGTSLIKASEFWLNQNKCLSHEVVTQLDNSAACNLYKKNGFIVKNIKYLYHL